MPLLSPVLFRNRPHLGSGKYCSGCVRATAVDTIQHGFRPIVARECVGDRHPALHEANLFDMNAKYADVLSKADVMDYLRGFAR